jgi:hypothetical protein
VSEDATPADVPASPVPTPAAALGDDAHALAPPFAAGALATAGERPELLVGGAFVGGLLVATILKRLGRD